MKLTIQTARPYSVILEKRPAGPGGGDGPANPQARLPGHAHQRDQRLPPLRERVKASLEKVGFAVSTFVFPAGEASKQLSTVLEMYSALARQGFTRTDFIVTLGGGVTGDMGALPRPPSCGACPSSRCPPRCSPRWTASVGGKNRRGPAGGQKPGGRLPPARGRPHRPGDPGHLAGALFPGRHGGGHQVRLHLR